MKMEVYLKPTTVELQIQKNLEYVANATENRLEVSFHGSANIIKAIYQEIMRDKNAIKFTR